MTEASDRQHAHQLVDHLFRNSAGQMVAWLTRVFGPSHLELVEEVVQDALLKALQHWPYSGIPENPAGWLFRVARNGALDVLRRDSAFRDRAAVLASELHRESAGNDILDTSAVQDDELRMVFMCCHPSLSKDARVALSLKIVGGFSVTEIARAFLTAESTIAQRLVRAKRQLREQRVGLDLPGGDDLTARLDSVLEVIYLLFNEGYDAHAGDELVRLDLCGEALRLGRLVADSPRITAPAAHALVALMAFQAARLPARVDEAGEMVLLEDQDRRLWDRRLVALGFEHLDRSAAGDEITSYHVQAAIAAVHAGEPATDWARVLALYEQLLAINPSPVIGLNHVVALSRVHGPAAALDALAPLEREPALANYYLLPSVKAALLAQSNRMGEATDAYRVALERPCSGPERRFLLRRIAECQLAAAADADSRG